MYYSCIIDKEFCINVNWWTNLQILASKIKKKLFNNIIKHVYNQYTVFWIKLYYMGSPYFLRLIKQINCEKDVIKVLENSNIQY